MFRILSKFLLQNFRINEKYLPRKTPGIELIPETAWTMLRDCYICPRFVLAYEPQEMAIAIIYLALKSHGIEKIPEADRGDRKPWYRIFYREMSSEKMYRIADEIMKQVYEFEK